MFPVFVGQTILNFLKSHFSRPAGRPAVGKWQFDHSEIFSKDGLTNNGFYVVYLTFFSKAC